MKIRVAFVAFYKKYDLSLDGIKVKRIKRVVLPPATW